MFEFDRKYLKAAANTSSYQRGLDYFEQETVGKIKREDNAFTAKVSGSYSYKTSIKLQPDGARFNCSCPYDFGGICKHLVALGLAMLQQFGVAELKAVTAAGSTLPAALAQALQTTPAEVQLAFLAGLLTENSELARQFLAHVAAPAPAKSAVSAADADPTSVESISTEVYEVLSDLEFDDDALQQASEYDYDDYLQDEGDAMLELADDIIDEVLEPYARLVTGHLAQGRLQRALDYWVGVYEGISAATDPATDDYDLFSYSGYSGYVLERWSELLAGRGLEPLLAAYPLPPAEAETTLAWLFDRYAAAGYPPDEFAGLLTALTHDPAIAARLRPRLENAAQPLSRDQAQVLLHTAEVLADDALWTRTAEAHAGQDFGLLLRLLDHYRQHDDRPNLLRLLKQYRDPFSHRLNAYVLEHVLPTEAEDLYLAALEQRCRSTQSLADYEQLCGYWSAARRREFVEEQVKLSARRGDALFGAELLLAENREAELLPLLLQLHWATARSIPELLALTAPTQPEACLDAVMERSEKLLTDTRGRDMYQRIAAWLTVLNQLEALRPQVALFAAHLYTEYVRLNALREELRAAQLVKTYQVGKQHRLVPPTPEDDELRELLRDRKKK